MPQPTLCSCLVAVHYFYLLMLIISDLLFPSFKMGIERANLEDLAGNLTHALVEFIGKFWSMVAHWKCLEARE